MVVALNIFGAKDELFSRLWCAFFTLYSHNKSVTRIFPSFFTSGIEFANFMHSLTAEQVLALRLMTGIKVLQMQRIFSVYLPGPDGFGPDISGN